MLGLLRCAKPVLGRFLDLRLITAAGIDSYSMRAHRTVNKKHRPAPPFFEVSVPKKKNMQKYITIYN